MRSSTANAPRRWWVAALLTIAARGTGQLYNGQWRKAAFAYFAPILLLFLASATRVPLLAQALLLAWGAVSVWAVADAAVVAFAHRKAHARRGFQRPVVYAAAIAGAWLAHAVVVDPFVVRVTDAREGHMQPAIDSGDRIVADMSAYLATGPRRGDVVLFRSPVDGSSRRVSRVIGLPGETIEIRDKQVLVDGGILRENWGRHGDPAVQWPSSPSPRDHYGPVRIGAGEYFVLDDNRDAGFDSRYWGRAVAADLIEGRAGVYGFSRHPQAGIRWQRIGRPIQREVPLPTDASPALYQAMGVGAALPASAATGMAAVLLACALGMPVGEARRLRRRRLVAAKPYSVEPAQPACVSEAVRPLVGADRVALSLAARLGALADASVHARRPLDVAVAECLNGMSLGAVDASELRTIVKHLDRLGRSRAVRDPGVRGLLQWRRAAAIQRLVRQGADDVSHQTAVAAYREALVETPRSHAPLRWAAIQNDLGTALQSLGEESGERSWFEQALAAYRASLQRRTRRKAPLDWATTQHNLGNCLRLLGEGDGDINRLLAAAEAYRAALTRRTRDHDPVGHAMTRNNLGIALRLIGARRGDPEPILQARHHHEESLRLLSKHAPAYAAVPAQNL